MKIRKNAKFEIRVNLCETMCVKNEIASKMFCYHISPLLRVFEVSGKIQKRYGILWNHYGIVLYKGHNRRVVKILFTMEG